MKCSLGSYSDSNAMHFYNILTVGQFSRKLSQIIAEAMGSINTETVQYKNAENYTCTCLAILKVTRQALKYI